MPDVTGFSTDAGAAADFAVTLFYSHSATRKTERRYTWQELRTAVLAARAKAKADLPWLKLARFGDAKTEAGSLRHDANLLAISGIEADYDGGLIPPAEAIERLEQAGIRALVYTSPSHTEDAPRWRVLCPTSTELPPERRAHLVGRLNGLLGGILAGESFTLSQSYYFGRVGANPSHMAELVDGEPIDLADHLDEKWRGKPQTGSTAGTAEAPRSGPMDEAALLREIATGSSYHTAQVRLLGAWARKGVPYMAARDRVIEAMEAVPDERRDARWRMRRGDVDRCLDDIYLKEAGRKDSEARQEIPRQEQEAKPKAPAGDNLADLVNPAILQGIEPPVREWVVDGWLPVGTVTSLYGGGGFGKTLLGQQLQAATALGRQFVGLPTLKCKSLGFYCEDDNDELHRRGRSICNLYGAQMGELGEARWQGRHGKLNVMATVENGLLKPSAFLEFVREAAKATESKLLILDNIAQLFGGNEVVRTEVTQFVNALGAIAQEIGGAVLLLGHPGKGDGSEYSGSTAWDAAVRSRWILERPKGGTGDDDEPPAELRDLRVLRKAKANYAGTGDEIALRWDAGAFRVEGGATLESVVEATDRRLKAAEDDLAFLACLDVLEQQGRHVSAEKTSTSYAAKAMHKNPAAKGMSMRRIDAAMERLFYSGQIEVKEVLRKNRHPTRAIVKKAPIAPGGPKFGEHGRHRE